MDLGQVYGFVSALGTLIGAIDHLIGTIRARGGDVHPAVDVAVTKLKDAHAELAAAVKA